MSVCNQAVPAPLRCPTLDELIAATMALLPPGCAWQSGELAEQLFHDAAFDPSAFDAGAFDTETKPGTVLFRWWSAFGAVRNYVEKRLCDLRLEFWCATHSETHDLWMKEYDLPDACDPFPDLCTKVAAIGGTRCEYFAAIAARAGWSIACINRIDSCPGGIADDAVADCAQAGAGIDPTPILEIVVYLPDSPAFTGPSTSPPVADCMYADELLSCPPSIAPLSCILERVVQAHVEIEYTLIS